MQALYNKKNKSKKELETLKNAYLGAIYKGLANKESKFAIHKELKRLTINSKIKNVNLYKQSLVVLSVVSKKMPKNDKQIQEQVSKVHNTDGITSVVTLSSMLLFDLFNKLDVNKSLDKEIYKDLNEKESEDKQNLIKNTLEYNRQLFIPNIFYLASGHDDCALDHRDAQFKIYVDEKWQSLITDKELKRQIKNYIQKHNVKTMQWVTSKPVWFVTRPNCRHYFKAISTSDVLNVSRKELIERNDMHRQVGERKYLQTLSHPTNKKWYEDKQNAISVLNKYRERLKFHRTLYRASANPLLEKAINKDYLLIKKWTNYLQMK